MVSKENGEKLEQIASLCSQFVLYLHNKTKLCHLQIYSKVGSIPEI